MLVPHIIASQRAVLQHLADGSVQSFRATLMLSKVSRSLRTEAVHRCLTRLTDQANHTYKQLLASELFPEPEIEAIPSVAGTPPQTPTKRQRIFNYSSPGASGSHTPNRTRPGLDSPSHEAYSTSPLRNSSQRLLTSPQRPIRMVGKTPYKVLDAPELAVSNVGGIT